MLRNSELESRVVTRMRFLLSVFVVMIHVFPSEYCYGLSQVVYVLFAQGICRVAVPMFFIVSGYYFFKGFDGEWDWHLYRSKLKSRIQTLLIPYILWNLLFFVLLAVRHRGGIDGIRELYNNCEGFLGIFWSGKNSSPLDFPLWFVRDLICVIIISPVLYYLLRSKISSIILFISLLLYKYFVGFSYHALFFFSLGGGIRLCGESLMIFRMKEKYLYVISLICLLMMNVTYSYNNTSYRLFLTVFEIVGAIAFFNICSRYDSLNKLSKFAPTSFFLFASHALIMQSPFYNIAPIVGKNLNDSVFVGGDLIACTFLTFYIVIVSLLCYIIMKRLFPSILNLIVGKRI